MISDRTYRGTARTCAIFMLLAAGLMAFCQGQGRDKFVKVFFSDGRSVTAELAVTEEERARGLMFRESLLADQGMLFVFAEEEPHAFWMKNTLIPLDILWLGSNRRVLHIEKNVPPCTADPCPSYGPETPAGFVLELKAGSSDVLGLKVGDRLDFALPSWLNPLRGIPRT